MSNPLEGLSINPWAGLRVNPWADLPVRPRPERKPKHKANVTLMAARARRARRLKQQTKAEASQAATA